MKPTIDKEEKNMTILRAFVNQKGEYGNPVGIIIDEGKAIPSEIRQKKATRSGLSEIVFINNIKANDISIFSPTGEIPFAGHAVIGAAFYLDKLKGENIDSVSSMGIKITVYHKLTKIWVRAELSKMPEWNFKQLQTVVEVEALTVGHMKDFEHCVVWAWINEKKGIIKARTFAPDWLIPEDEANGSGSLLLASQLNKEIRLYHGKGLVICARPVNSMYGEVGGTVVMEKE